MSGYTAWFRAQKHTGALNCLRYTSELLQLEVFRRVELSLTSDCPTTTDTLAVILHLKMRAEAHRLPPITAQVNRPLRGKPRAHHHWTPASGRPAHALGVYVPLVRRFQ
ncbi:MAG: hypothetical protein CM1200mP14_16550 [Gammaproteobacteria bacterium]|nr:MAG: hypothetical protein CM1200mP14_16550 [Gammaproteobacteria bacterium]